MDRLPGSPAARRPDSDRNPRIARRMPLAYPACMIQHAVVPARGMSGTSLDMRWKALASRDPAADGTFVDGVTSIGVYCRPSCRSPRPRADRVRFFDTAAEAGPSGFRACKRCRPDMAANACAANPVAIVVPCHRVVPPAGGTGG